MFKYEGKYFTLVCDFSGFWDYYYRTDFSFFTNQHKRYILKLAQYEVYDELEEYLKKFDVSNPIVYNNFVIDENDNFYFLYDEELDNVVEELIEKYKETKSKEILNNIDILIDCDIDEFLNFDSVF